MTENINRPAVRSLRETLRRTTKDAHRRLDHHPLMAPLVHTQLRLSHYVLVLQILHELHALLNVPLDKAMQVHRLNHLYSPSPRIEWLEKDLADLGLRPFHTLRAPDLPIQVMLDSPAAIVGTLYVIEGSTLGGLVIARQLRTLIGVTPELGGRFFHGHGEGTLERWEAFWRFADLVCGSDEFNTASIAAQETFAYVGRFFDANLGNNPFPNPK